MEDHKEPVAPELLDLVDDVLKMQGKILRQREVWERLRSLSYEEWDEVIRTQMRYPSPRYD
jgi:hypothetical protein